MNSKHYKELLTGIKIVNPEIVDISKKIIVIIGCPDLSNRLVDVVDEVIKAHGCQQIDDQSYYDVNLGEKECFDDSHPVDQIKYVKTLVEQLDKDALPKRMFVYTNSPFVLQSFFHFNGRPALNIAYYECGFNDAHKIVLTDVSADTRSAFARMAEAMNEIMSITQYFNRQ
jgi:hypothetical protein